MEPLKLFNEIKEADGRWNMFTVDLPKLYQISNSMSLNKNVPEYVMVQFQQAQHLLVYSYLQFSLLSVAQTQALIAVEFALKTRWENDDSGLIKNRSKSPGLKMLLTNAFGNGWVSVNDFDQKILTLLPTLRNSFAHGDYSLNPMGTLEIVRLCGEFIQRLYP